MKKMVLVIALAAIALSGSAFAQDPAYFDNIGIYLDEEATNSCDVLPVGAHNAFLVLTKMTANEVLGWECKLIVENMFMTGFALRGTGLDVATREGEHIVGLESPLLAIGGAVIIADLEILLGNTDPGAIYVNEVYFSLLENGLPAYLDGASAGYTLHPANAYDPGYLGSVADPIFVTNGDCITVATEEASFGSVKSLFR